MSDSVMVDSQGPAPAVGDNSGDVVQVVQSVQEDLSTNNMVADHDEGNGMLDP